MNREQIKQYRFVLVMGMAFGVILFIDQLYLFGVPFGGFLGDLSELDPTGREDIHHWMLGIVLITICSTLYIALRRR